MSKKFILFIVEGENDKKELDAILHSSHFAPYRESYEPWILPVGCDITAEKGATTSNIQERLNKILLFFRRNGVPFRDIKVSDIQEIVQIVDMDGAFIPRENIVKDNNSAFQYDDECIRTANTDGAIGRNRRKAEILKKLLTVTHIGNIPYSLYFASCNMDHLLFNERNLSKLGKRENADKFRLMCKKTPECLLETVFCSGIKADGSYDESWQQIQQRTESLKRHTNINLYLCEGAKNSK